MSEERNLTDADVDAIVQRLRSTVIRDFYADLGRGVWALVQKAFIIAVVAVAAWGALRK